MSDDVIAAVRANDIEGTRTRLAMGADVDARDEHGWTALCWAAGAGATPIVRVLLEYGADPGLTGNEGRTPYQIALAATRVDTARVLAQAERARGATPSDRLREQMASRPYCRAYLLRELRRFSGWRDEASQADADADTDAVNRAPAADDTIVFVHADYSVTRTIWPGEDRLFAGTIPEWRRFCVEQLAFLPPDDFDALPER